MQKKSSPFINSIQIGDQKLHVILAKCTKDATLAICNTFPSKKIILIPYSRFLWSRHKLRFEQDSNTRCYFYTKGKNGSLCFFDKRNIALHNKKKLNTHPLNIDTDQGYILQNEFGLKGDFLFRMSFDCRFKDAFEIKKQKNISFFEKFILRTKEIQITTLLHLIYKKALTKLDSISP
ncbi:MAG: hypothetical protein FJZ57_08455 [Chlamydiae bacterium]|nr:hypothetical protein [Chlamydiota bacterium]